LRALRARRERRGADEERQAGEDQGPATPA